MASSILEMLIAGSFVGGTAAYLGSLMITHRMALVGDALGHIALPGMGISLLLHIDPSLGAFTFLTLGTLLIWKLRKTFELSLETLVGIIFVSSLALGFLIVPQPELLESLFGEISSLTIVGTLLTALISLIVCAIVARIYPAITLISISEELASVEGVSRTKSTLLFLLAIALMVSLGIKLTGSLLVGALVIIPPATARVISRNLKQYIQLSTLIGIASSVTGILVSTWLRLQPGPIIILTSSLLFLIIITFKKMQLL